MSTTDAKELAEFAKMAGMDDKSLAIAFGHARLIVARPNGRECRYSDGTTPWPGWAKDVKLAKGYWIGTDECHARYDGIESDAEAVAFMEYQF